MKSPFTPDSFPTYCTRDAGHDGPCNGYSRALADGKTRCYDYGTPSAQTAKAPFAEAAATYHTDHGKIIVGISIAAAERKATPLATGVIDYFPDALKAVAQLSKIGNDQHNPGQPLHWSREKSTDHADCLMRHFTERDTFDTDGVRHSAKVAWRALALLQVEIEEAAKPKPITLPSRFGVWFKLDKPGRPSWVPDSALVYLRSKKEHREYVYNYLPSDLNWDGSAVEYKVERT